MRISFLRISTAELVICAYVCLVTWCLSGCGDSDSQTSLAESERYTFAQPSRAGSGKFYMGREISQVMGHLGAGWLERSTRETEERTDLLLQNLPIEAESVVADIGAGSGYFTIPMAQRASSGRVYAVDIEMEMLNLLRENASAKQVSNIEPILATETDPGLPPSTLDLALLVDAYHEFSFPFEVMTKVFASLKRGGHAVLVEYRGEDPSVPIFELHKMTQAQVIEEMQAAGFEWAETRDFLPQQHFMLFKKP